MVKHQHGLWDNSVAGRLHEVHCSLSSSLPEGSRQRPLLASFPLHFKCDFTTLTCDMRLLIERFSFSPILSFITLSPLESTTLLIICSPEDLYLLYYLALQTAAELAIKRKKNLPVLKDLVQDGHKSSPPKSQSCISLKHSGTLFFHSTALVQLFFFFFF